MPGEQPPAGSAQQPRTRADVRPLTISDVIEPVTANKNLQALAIEQIKYPRLLRPVAVVAYGDSGRITELTGLVDGKGGLNWQAPERSIVYALFPGSHGKLVERAAPGGEGYVIDHFSRDAIRAYLSRFDRAFDAHGPSGLRAFQRLMRWTTRRARETGRRGFSMSSRNVAATICGGTFRPCSERATPTSTFGR